MPAGTFVVHRAERFPDREGRWKTDPQRPRGARDWQSAPVFTAVTAGPAQSDYRAAKVIHRTGLKFDGLFREEVVRELVKVESFPAYLHAGKRLLIAQANRDLAYAAFARLSSELPKLFLLRPITIDFERLRANLPSDAAVDGAWFRRPQGSSPIHTQALFGEGIEGAREFVRLSAGSRINNLTVSLPFAGELLRAGISRRGSAFFRGDYPLKLCLGFLEYLADFEAAALQHADAAPTPAVPKPRRGRSRS